jgi:hypothetical protein
MSGEHNVRYYLRQHDIEERPVFIENILAAAKRSDVLLTEKDVLRMVTVMQERLSAGDDILEADLDNIGRG